MASDASRLNSWAAADAPYAQACCPAGWQCARRDAQFWQCMPSKVLDTCTGPKTIALNAACGGTQLCGKDSTCGKCCVNNAFCLRESAAAWKCHSLTEFKLPASLASNIETLSSSAAGQRAPSPSPKPAPKKAPVPKAG